jgi:hypothetical protein
VRICPKLRTRSCAESVVKSVSAFRLNQQNKIVAGKSG